MRPDLYDQDLIQYLCRIKGFSDIEAIRLIDELLSYFNETCEIFVQRRHGELRKSGQSNAAIYSCIQKELRHRRFVASELSERQIRRIIYG
ncbi:MAG: hypothetical protein ACR2QW_15700 [bacterium]